MSSPNHPFAYQTVGQRILAQVVPGHQDGVSSVAGLSDNPLSDEEQAMLDEITAELIAQLWGVDPDSEEAAPLFANDLCLAHETLDARLVAVAQSVRFAGEKSLAGNTAAFAHASVRKTIRELALQHLQSLEAEFKAANPDDWQPHSIKRGPRKGQQVWKNVKTGSLRDDPPQAGNKKDAADAATPTPAEPAQPPVAVRVQPAPESKPQEASQPASPPAIAPRPNVTPDVKTPTPEAPTRESMDKLSQTVQELAAGYQKTGEQIEKIADDLGAKKQGSVMDTVGSILQYIKSMVFGVPLKDRMEGDKESAGYVASVAQLFHGDYAQKAESLRATNMALAEIAKKPELKYDDAVKYKALSSQAEGIQASMNDQVESHRQALYNLIKPDKAAGIDVFLQPGVGVQQHVAAIGAMQFYQKTLSALPKDPAVFTKIALCASKTQDRSRAKNVSAGNAEVSLAGNSVATAVHEFGHVIEFHQPGVKKAATEFYKLRGLDQEKSVNLKDKYPGLGYGEGETGKKDDFGKYFGDTVGAYYCGKKYDDGSTELISMGVEHLYRDPAGFCAKDPQYAQFIIGVLKGTLR